MLMDSLLGFICSFLTRLLLLNLGVCVWVCVCVCVCGGIVFDQAVG